MNEEAINKSRNITFHVVEKLLAAYLLLAAIFKFSGSEELKTSFTKWGLEDYIYYVGIIELICTILLVIPKTRLYGMIGWTLTLFGAIYVHVTNQEPFFLALAIIISLWLNYLIIKTKKK